MYDVYVRSIVFRDGLRLLWRTGLVEGRDHWVSRMLRGADSISIVLEERRVIEIRSCYREKTKFVHVLDGFRAKCFRFCGWLRNGDGWYLDIVSDSDPSVGLDAQMAHIDGFVILYVAVISRLSSTCRSPGTILFSYRMDQTSVSESFHLRLSADAIW